SIHLSASIILFSSRCQAPKGQPPAEYEAVATSHGDQTASETQPDSSRPDPTDQTHPVSDRGRPAENTL
ncbi:hypothetical protein GOODEAATRI_001662, partial [Goodea atripinnis]